MPASHDMGRLSHKDALDARPPHPAGTDNGRVKFQLLSDLHLETQPD